jgi:hypothetical protein
MRLFIILPLVALLAACAAVSDGPGATPDPTSSERTPEPSPTPEPSLRPASIRPTPRGGDTEGAMTITGRLGFDDIEGGCPYVQSDDGTRYQVLWPTGWRLDGRGDLISPEGERVARQGEEVAVRGQVADDMASICQIGPIFRADEVLGDDSS